MVGIVTQHPYQRSGSYHKKPTKTCIYWRRGCCNRPNCRFDHHLSAQSRVWRRNLDAIAGPPSFNNNNRVVVGEEEKKQTDDLQAPEEKPAVDHQSKESIIIKKEEEEEEENSCEESNQGEKCQNLHQWFTIVATLVGHQKAVTGIALPSGSNVLYTGSEDGFVRAWDCNTGKCLSEDNLGSEIGCMTTEGPWLFVGITNAVKAGHTQKFTEQSLSGPKGQVYCLEFFENMLIAGTQDGSILTWKLDSEGKSFQQGPSLTGHSLAVVSMTLGNRKLYTGSMDQSIKVWDLDKFEMVQTLIGHASVVMSVLWCNQFIISCSLDKTIKVWGLTEIKKIGEIYSRTEEHGLIALKGWKEEKGKPMLLCSCNDNSICLYDLPLFIEKGRIFSKEKVRSIHIGPGGLVFTGDGAGEVKVWKLSPEEEIPTVV
ncbi:hypothetical protein J5N97_000944 [Dioscorea zingiberensis]|uniref:C3H1-type domain-containing protein n=1 Tax=Dioscorea zingiberensis TaxID=325984 RepID=A0A9D5BUU3_9LILI|nr:hypothetical protein J5N97_000944 [Dioscorea zingiberensis]